MSSLSSNTMQHNATDLSTLNRSQLDDIAALRQQAATGQISWADANQGANRVRANAGYSMDPHGAVTQLAPQMQMPDFSTWLTQNGFDGYSSATQAAIKASVDKAVNGYQAQMDSANQDSDKLAKQAYIAKMLGQKNLDQQMDAQGYAGGMADQARIQTETDYQNNLNTIELQRQNVIKQLQKAIADAQLTGNMQTAQELQSYLTNMQGQWQSYIANQQQLQSSNYWNQKQMDNSDYWNTQEQKKQNQSNAYSRAMSFLQAGIVPSSSELAAAEISLPEAEQIRRIYARQTGTTSSSSRSSSARRNSGTKTKTSSRKSAGYSNGGLSASQVAQVQRYIGVTPDGKWGHDSYAAADGMTAQQAWAAYQSKASTAKATSSGGMNPNNFTASALSISSQLAAGKYTAATDNINRIWNSLSAGQKTEINNLLHRFGMTKK